MCESHFHSAVQSLLTCTEHRLFHLGDADAVPHLLQQIQIQLLSLPAVTPRGCMSYSMFRHPGGGMGRSKHHARIHTKHRVVCALRMPAPDATLL